MPFSYDYSEELMQTLKKLRKKHKPLYEAVLKKIDEIISRDGKTIDFYKNLRNDLSNFKRVHVLKHYVLFFSVDKENKHIFFQKIRHHDEAYLH
jgi:mRNA-degrading endonuclease RelE of RelBE toxin-antitoxin system